VQMDKFLSLSMFTDLMRDPKEITPDGLRTRFFQEKHFGGLELVPSLLWGQNWDFEVQDLETINCNVTAIQSLTFGVPLVLSVLPPKGSSLEGAWKRRLTKLSQLSEHFKDATFILGSPSQRRLSGLKPKEAQGVFERYILDLLEFLPGSNTISLENCNQFQGSEFGIGLEGAINTIHALNEERVGLNFDFESWVAELDADESPNFEELEKTMADVKVTNIQFGRSALTREAINFLHQLAIKNHCAMSVEDSRLGSVKELMELHEIGLNL
jgi:hypothetical protein